MTGKQIAAARALFGWGQRELADAANLSVPTIKHAEGGGIIRASDAAVAEIRAAFRREASNSSSRTGGEGVTLRG